MAEPTAASYTIRFNPAGAQFIRNSLQDRADQIPAYLAGQFNEALGRTAGHLSAPLRLHVTALNGNSDSTLNVNVAFTEAGAAILKTRARLDEIDEEDALTEAIEKHFCRKNGWSINKCAVLDVSLATEKS